MFFRILIVILLLLMTGCSGRVSETNIELQEYLPDGEIGTKYISFLTHTGNSAIKEEKTIISKTNNCITLNIKLIRDGHRESNSTKKFCVKNNILYSDNILEEYPLIDLNKKSWKGYKMHIEGQDTDMMCALDSTGKVFFDNEEHQTLVVKCEAKNIILTFIYATKLGLVEIKQMVKDFGIVGGIKLESIVSSKENRG